MSDARRWDNSHTPAPWMLLFWCAFAGMLALLVVQQVTAVLEEPSSGTILRAVLCTAFAVKGIAVVITWLRLYRTVRIQWIEIGPESVSWAKTNFGWDGLRTDCDHVPLALVRGVNFIKHNDGDEVRLLRTDGSDHTLLLPRRDWAEFVQVLQARLPNAAILENGRTPVALPSD